MLMLEEGASLQSAAARVGLGAQRCARAPPARRFGVLATISSRGSEEGFPAGSVVEYVADEQVWRSGAW